MENCFASSKAAQSDLSLKTALTSARCLSFGESRIAFRFEPRPETKTAITKVLSIIINYAKLLNQVKIINDILLKTKANANFNVGIDMRENR